MPDLLREQFPHFRPIVEAFGYRNLEFEGWEADDVIATLATRADEAGVKTTASSRPTATRSSSCSDERLPDDDAARRRGRPRLHARAGRAAATAIRPDQVPDFIGLKGDTSDNIPGIPGIGDKTAGQLIAQYGSLEEVHRARGRALAGPREERSREHADQARAVEGARDDARATSTSTSIRPSSCSSRPTARS